MTAFHGYSGLAALGPKMDSLPSTESASIALVQTPKASLPLSSCAMALNAAGVAKRRSVAYTGKAPRSAAVGPVCHFRI